MPDYNPAVATGVQPPENNFANTLGTIANLQEKQALTGYYTLQGLQQQRRYIGLTEMGNYAATHPGDNAGIAAIGGKYGIEPDITTQYINQNALQKFTAQHGGYNPQGAEAGATIALRGAETANARAQLPKFEAESQQAGMDVKGRYAQSFLGDQSEGNRVRVVGDAISNGVIDRLTGAQLLQMPLSQFTQAMRGVAQRGLSVEQGSKVNQTENQEGAPVYQTTAQIAAGGVQSNAGVVGASPQQKEQQKYYGELYKGISALGDQAASSKEDIRLAKAAINDPNFWSGTGQNYNLMYKKALALGGDTSAVPQEVFKKVMAANVNQQVTQMKAAAEQMGASSSRLFLPQIQLMQDAAQNPENTVASNRVLTEIADRASDKNMRLADSAANYKNGKLDPQFEKQFRKDASAPVFSRWELGHLATIGAPMAEKLKQIDPQELQHLRENPGNREKFDSYYGPGTARAVLGR